MPMPFQSRNRPSVPTHPRSAYHDHTHVPSSPVGSAITSSTPSGPCKQTSPIKGHKVNPCTDSLELVNMCTRTRTPPGTTQTQPSTSLASAHARSHWKHVSNIRQTLHGQCSAALLDLIFFSLAEYVLAEIFGQLLYPQIAAILRPEDPKEILRFVILAISCRTRMVLSSTGGKLLNIHYYTLYPPYSGYYSPIAPHLARSHKMCNLKQAKLNDSFVVSLQVPTQFPKGSGLWW